MMEEIPLPRIVLYSSAFRLGAYSPGETPVPIPNTAVKPGHVDGSMANAMRE